MNTTYKKYIAWVFLFAIMSSGAKAASVLIIGSEDQVSSRLSSVIPDGLDVMNTNLAVDMTSKKIVTDEGTKLDSGALFAKNAEDSAKAIGVLATEYAPDFILLGWVSKEKVEEYASYGLELMELSIKARMVDAKTGKVVFEKQHSHNTEFSVASSDGELRGDVLSAALAKLDQDALLSAYDSFLAKAQGVENRLRIVVRQIDQARYFALRELMLDAVSRAGVEGEPRVNYAASDNEATIRVVTSKKVADFYRELYASFSAEQGIDGFDIARDGNNIDLTLKPQAPRLISVKTLSPTDYGSIGRLLVSTVSQAPGVSDIAQRYSEKDQTLVISFLLTGKSLYSVDGAIWDAINDDPRFNQFAMGELDQREIEYFFSGKDSAANSDVIVILSGVNAEQYKEVATRFSDLVSKLSGVRDLRYRYDYENQSVVYRLKHEGDGLHVLDDAIARAMVADELFAYVSKGVESLGRLNYAYNESAKELEEKMAQAEAIQKDSPAMGSAPALESLDHTVVYIETYIDGEAMGSGSGFFVSESGYIITNEHVISDADNYASHIFIRTFNGDEYRARMINVDVNLDLALLKVVTNTDVFSPVTIGDSESLGRGQPIIVIGNPGGQRFEHSVLTGIVSGINRDYGLLQLSVPTYGGVSGAPVFNQAGEVVGIMVAVPQTMTSTTVKVGNETQEIPMLQQMNEFGYAIPVNYARSILQHAH